MIFFLNENEVNISSKMKENKLDVLEAIIIVQLLHISLVPMLTLCSTTCIYLNTVYSNAIQFITNFVSNKINNALTSNHYQPLDRNSIFSNKNLSWSSIGRV